MGIIGKFLGKRKPRAVLIGLDGVPHSLVKRLADRGVCPHLGRLVARGENHFKQMDASLPEVSSVSWTSFMTGANPAQHGIFGFMDLKPDSYKMYFPSYPHLRKEPIWDRLGRKGKRTVVVNLPGTYPARGHEGVLISGFVAIDIRKAVHPSSLLPRLEGLGYRIDVDTSKARDDDFLYRDLHETLDAREKAFHMLWKEEDWDLFVAVITGTDRLQHFQWDAVADYSHTNHSRAMEYYAAVDGAVGRLLDLGGSEDTFYLMSDHGFTGIESEVYLNRFLVERGYLSWEKDPPDSYEDIASASRAFAMDPSRIYLHRKGRYPRGCVEEGEVASLREEIKAAFLDLDRNGEKVISEVFFPEEIYDGPLMAQAPDLVLLTRDGFDLKGNIRKDTVFDRTHFTGMHNRHDAFLMGTSPLPDRRPHIQDVPGLLLQAIGEE